VQRRKPSTFRSNSATVLREKPLVSRFTRAAGWTGTAKRSSQSLTEDINYTLEDRALLAEFSAKLYETDAMKHTKARIEIHQGDWAVSGARL